MKLALEIGLPICGLLMYVFVAGMIWSYLQVKFPERKSYSSSYADDHPMVVMATVLWPLLLPGLTLMWIFSRPPIIKAWWKKRHEVPEELVQELADAFKGPDEDL